MLKNALGIFRVIGFAEGISYLLLLGVAMPLKYLMDLPLTVTIVGAIHGGLFVLYILAALGMKLYYQWPFHKLLLAGVASVLPFGPFIFDKRLSRDTNGVNFEK